MMGQISRASPLAPLQRSRAEADEWLKANLDRLGVESTVDLESKYF
jgi:hypothetical protein